MTITKIRVSSGATFSHPCERFANFRTHVGLEADLQPEDDIALCVRQLQITADSLSAQHQDSLLSCARAKAKLQGTDWTEPSEESNEF